MASECVPPYNSLFELPTREDGSGLLAIKDPQPESPMRTKSTPVCDPAQALRGLQLHSALGCMLLTTWQNQHVQASPHISSTPGSAADGTRGMGAAGQLSGRAYSTHGYTITDVGQNSEALT